MEQRRKVSLDNPALQGRVRSTRAAFVYDRPHGTARGRVDGFHAPASKSTQPLPRVLAHAQPTTNSAQVVTKSQPQASPARVVKKVQPYLPRQSRSKVLHRQVVGKKIPKAYRPKKYRRPLLPVLITTMAVFLFSFGAFAVISTLHSRSHAKMHVKGATSIQPTDDGITEGLPSEDDAPTDISDYTVAPDLPRFFDIEKLGVHARVRQLGVSNNNVLKSPSNIFDVGWYDGSAKPGENGTVVLDGHVSGQTKRGVFYGIGTLAKGDKVSIERGDGKKISYTVTGTKVYDNDKVDMAKVMTTSVPGKAAMNFITCTGRFNVRTNQYEHRVVVFTIQD